MGLVSSLPFDGECAPPAATTAAAALFLWAQGIHEAERGTLLIGLLALQTLQPLGLDLQT